MGQRMVYDICVRVKKSLAEDAALAPAPAAVTRSATAGELKPGRAVRALRAFVGVPPKTEGVVVEDYGRGVYVRWANGIRDAFDKATEILWLEAVAFNPSSRSSRCRILSPGRKARGPTILLSPRRVFRQA